MSVSKIVAAAASGAGGAGLDVDEVFSTFLYEGNGANRVIENGIALGNSFSSGSGSFSGTSANNGTRVNIPTSANFNFGTGDFTIEAFIYLKTSKNYHNFYDQRTPTQDSTTNSPIIYIDSNNYIIFYVGGSGRAYSSALSLGVWYHVAVTRASGSTKMFLNGTQQGNAYSDSLTYVQPASDFSFGGSLEQNSYNLDGFISNLRVVKGTAIYTSNFTAPTADLTAVSGTSLLTAQGSTPFVDNSGNSVALTLNNSPVASDFGPFTGTGGEGGLVWIKDRDAGFGHNLFDTARGVGKYINSDGTAAEATDTTRLSSFTTSGFSLGSQGSVNTNNNSLVSWTWRKAPKFFDVVTYTGNGSSGHSISHSLGSVPGMIIVKNLDDGSLGWRVWHRSLTNPYSLSLNSTGAANSDAGYFTTTDPTSSVFYVGDSGWVNQNNSNFIAYLFAHNNNDGKFGPDSDQDIIKCGSYSGNGSTTGVFQDLGFEPQWIMFKLSNATDPWVMLDNMRGVSGAGSNDPRLQANSDVAEAGGEIMQFNATGFTPLTADAKVNGSGKSYVYMAIRRGPLAAPDDATKVFGMQDYTGGGDGPVTGFVTDMSILGQRAGGNDKFYVGSRLTGTKALNTTSTAAEANQANQIFDRMDGAWNGNVSTYMLWGWKRAPSYFDVVCHNTGSSATQIKHNLGVTPELAIYRNRSGDDWNVISVANGVVKLNSTDAAFGSGNGTYLDKSYGANASATHINGAGLTGNNVDLIIYLFASLSGISKIGVYTGNGSSQNIDCGFSSGARFVLIKRTDTSEGWKVHDSVRGIVAGDDPFLELNNTNAENSSFDLVDPYSGGFAVNNYAGWNASGGTYLFYAIA